MQIKSIITKVNIFNASDNPIYGESVTTIELIDNGGGPFFEISQNEQKIQLEIKETRKILNEMLLMYNQN